jgi:hypothetical protein
MIDNGIEIGFRNLWEHLPDGSAGILFVLAFRLRAAMEDLSRRIILESSGDPIGRRRKLAKTSLFVVDIAELAAREVDNLDGKVVSDSVDVVRKFLGISVHLVPWLRLWVCQRDP